MCDDRYCRKNTNLIISHKCSGNQDAVHEIMNAVTDQNHPTTATSILSVMSMVMGVSITFVMVVMTQEGNFLKQEKAQ